MTIAVEDRLAIEELIKLHGHIVDQGAWDRLHEVFDPAAVLDLSAFGGGQLQGLDAIRDAALKLGDKNPVAHHVTNIVLRAKPGGVTAVSKGFGVRTDGTVGSVVYEDRIHSSSAGWRILHRRIAPREVPLQ
jgi:hypothetical protein